MNAIRVIRVRRGLAAGASIVLGTALWLADPGAAATDEKPMMSGSGERKPAEYVPGPVDSMPMLKFADGMISLNDRCMVRHAKLNPGMPPVYVSGHPVGFC